jgi:hypothetical protein
MAAENTSGTQDTGLAPAPLETQGGDDFANLLGQEGAQDTSKKTGGDSSPEDLSKPAQTLKKPADAVSTAVASPDGTKPAAAQTATSPIDPKVLEEIVAASTRGVQKATAASATATAQQKKDAKEMTPQEFNAKYQIRVPTVEDIKLLLQEDPVKAAQALNDLLMANTRTAVLMASDVFQAQLAKARSEYEPHVQSWKTYQAQQREQAAQQSFYTKYPDLANEKELVQEMIDSLKAKVDAKVVSFQSDDQVFEAVAAASRKLLARMNTQASAGAAGKTAQSNNNGQPPPRQMATASTAGRSGTGQTAAKSDVDEVFGADAR